MSTDEKPFDLLIELIGEVFGENSHLFENFYRLLHPVFLISLNAQDLAKVLAAFQIIAETFRKCEDEQ